MPKIQDRIVELRRVRAGDLIPHPGNHRRHPEAQRRALRAALEQVGMASAVLAREDDEGRLHIVDGHLRQEEVDPDEILPVLVLDVTAEEADILLVTVDAITGLAELDLDALGELAAPLDLGEGLAEVVDDLLGADGGTEVEEDEIPDPPSTPKTQLGDVYQLGRHRVICGDSTDKATVEKLLGDAQPFLMVTDPPYGVEYDPAWRNEFESTGDSRALGVVQNDDRSDWRESWRLSGADVCYVWHASVFTHTVAESLEATDFELRYLIIWAKSNFAIGRGHYHHKHEPCWYGVRKGKQAKWQGDRSQTTVWDIDKPTKSETGHSTQKPLECMARPIRHHGEKEDLVYDPFLGSGTTLITAEQLGRTCYGCELDPAYVDVIVQRWENLTGLQAERVSP